MILAMENLDPHIGDPFATTPPSICRDVLDFCARINPEEQPTFLEPMPFLGAAPGECYANVAEAMKKAGGSYEVSGWLIWLWPGVFIEAEHHMVMGLVDGIVDVTPPPSQENRLLFLPDPKSPFDRTTNRLFRNRHHALCHQEEVMTMARAGADLKALSGDTFGQNVLVDYDEVQRCQTALLLAKDALLKRLRKGRGRNDPCFCGNGKKYKKCHGENF